MDNIAALLGNTQRPEELRMAQALRGQQSQGDFLGMSTLQPVAQLGQNMSKRSADGAKAMGGLVKARQEREAKVDASALTASARAEEQDALNEYRTGQQDDLTAYRADQQALAREKMAETIRNNNLRHTSNLERNKAYAASRKNGLPKRASEGKSFEDIGTTTAEIMDVADSFEDAYGTESRLPKLGAAQNFIATEAPSYATEGMQEQRDWWAKWGIIYTLPERHELFGAALTKEEKPEWEKHAINPDMSPEVIKENMTWLVDKAREVAKRQVGNAKAKGWNQDYIDVNYGMLGLDEDEAAADVGELQMKDAVMGLTPEEAMELEELEARMGGIPQ